MSDMVMNSKRVDLPQAGASIEVAPGQTILEAALASGIAYPHGCRSGRCGSCKSRLNSGEVALREHSRFALSVEEKAEGLILACRAIPKTDATVTWLGGADELADHPRRRLQCSVVGIEDVTHDIKIVRVRPKDGRPVSFTAGQFARVTFPATPTRDYSMANPPGADELEFHIRRVPDGVASNLIHSVLDLGDPVMVEGPFGSSFLREKHAGPILCVAGGSGLAPIKSIVETALARGMRQPIHVYFGVRTENDLYLVDHFEGLASIHGNLAFTPVLSDQASGTALRTGYVDAVVAKDLPDLDGWKAYIAGPPPIVEAVMVLATNRRLRVEDMHADVFFTPDEPLASAAAG